MISLKAQVNQLQIDKLVFKNAWLDAERKLQFIKDNNG